jgi:Domain of unknown function (DUF4365)
MIQKSAQQEIDRQGRRLVREAFEPLGWVLTDFNEDYGIDYDVQVFANGSPTGLWFKIQLKSSASGDRSSDGSFISLQMDVDHAKHYSLELRDPVFLIHADVQAKRVFWHAPQLDTKLIEKLTDGSDQSTIAVRVLTANSIPAKATEFLETVEKLYIVLANKTLANSSDLSFANVLRYQSGEDKLREEYQRKNDILKLRRVQELIAARQYPEARSRAKLVVSDPDSTIENRFWAVTKVGMIDWAEAVSNERSQAELPSIYLNNAKELQVLVKKGPPHLKFFALIARKAAELDELSINNWGITILLHQHRTRAGNPFMALQMKAAHALNTMRFVAKYNQCVRLARYASNFKGRWVLPLALTRIVQASASFIARIGTMDVTEMGETAAQFRSSSLQICTLIAWIGEESGDQEAIGLAISAALIAVTSIESDAFKWATRTLDLLTDADARSKTTEIIQRQISRWNGEKPEHDSYRDPAQQVIENAAATLGIDLSDENDPIVQGLRVAVRDNTPEKVLRTCEYIMTSLGATGPTARRIAALFGTQMAGSKILHCALHSYHLEGKDFDSALSEFKSKYCDRCPDRAPRSNEWEYTNEVRQELEEKHREFVGAFNSTGAGYRFTPSD